MPAEDNKAVVRRFVEEFKNKANHNIVDQLCAPSFVHHFKDPRLPAGREGLKILGRTVAAAFPDVRVAIEDLLSDGEKVVERTIARGTHRGEFNGIPPTGRPVAWTEIHIYRLSQGKITELWSEFDSAGMLMQLGAVPSPAQTPL
ncbi:MAG TPA: ester cyclase [bacterium]|nr:ester cyclase [bacterium]